MQQAYLRPCGQGFGTHTLACADVSFEGGGSTVGGGFCGTPRALNYYDDYYSYLTRVRAESLANAALIN